MAISAELSRKLYETLGDEAANAMVDWMHRVDAQRAELRELNELTTSRLDARFDQVDARFDQVDARFEQVDRRFEQVDRRFEQVDRRFERLETQLHEGLARVEIAMERTRSDVIKWAFGFWLGSLVTVVGALVALARLLP